ncbi:hypothetical protein AAG570_000924 [Ranatra chinensis]|uniref:Uncharacterized protein n=1 Tax=Ranatra chinensis TaxID=642074 RepID=A0ABD0ZFD6_9HEMI
MASKRRNMFHKNKTQETTEEVYVWEECVLGGGKWGSVSAPFLFLPRGQSELLAANNKQFALSPVIGQSRTTEPEIVLKFGDVQRKSTVRNGPSAADTRRPHPGAPGLDPFSSISAEGMPLAAFSISAPTSGTALPLDVAEFEEMRALWCGSASGETETKTFSKKREQLAKKELFLFLLLFVTANMIWQFRLQCSSIISVTRHEKEIVGHEKIYTPLPRPPMLFNTIGIVVYPQQYDTKMFIGGLSWQTSPGRGGLLQSLCTPLYVFRINTLRTKRRALNKRSATDFPHQSRKLFPGVISGRGDLQFLKSVRYYRLGRNL